jgi:hypothetical protein
MTYPWSSGDVLTASDLNAYAGLILVKTQTVGTAVSSVTVTGAFSSTFDNYRVIYFGGVFSSAGNWLLLQLGTATSNGYYGGTKSLGWTGVEDTLARNNNDSLLVARLGGAYGETATTIDIFGPNLVMRTSVTALGTGYLSFVYGGGVEASSSQHTSLTLKPSAGTMTGGTIRVYGYNNG